MAPKERQPLLSTPSAPKGGGALRGIGEKFTTNPATGTAAFEVPIAVPEGRGGCGPALSLSYDSGAGNGPFGFGWQLAVPAITRKTDRGLPRYGVGEREDTFILAGSEDLVRVPGHTVRGDYTVFTYRPRTEGSFNRIERWVKNGDSHWRVTTPENTVSMYGTDLANRIADPQDPANRVFSWLLEETRDDKGNITRFEYAAEDGRGPVNRGTPSELCRFSENGTFLATAQRYLKRILYGNAVPDIAGGWLFEVVLDYGEHDPLAPEPDRDMGHGADGDVRSWRVRADPFSTHRPGFDLRSYRLCRRILCFHRFPAELGEAPCLVRSTDFDYNEAATGATLRSVTQAGYIRGPGGGYEREAMPPLEFGYTEVAFDDRLRTFDPKSLVGVRGGVDGARSQWIDLDSEGLPGVLTATPGAWYYKANLGGGILGPPERLEVMPAPAELGTGRQQLADLAGDGGLSLVQYGKVLPGYFARSGEGGWEPFRAFPSVPRIDWNDPNLRFVDLDGDGIADILLTQNDVFMWFRSRGKDGFDPPVVVDKAANENEGPTVLFADGTESIQLADLNGDGLLDIVRVRNGEVSYWPNVGYGRFGAKITMNGSPIFDARDQFDPRRVRLADLDGTGPTDLVYSGSGGVFFWLNRSGNGWGPRQKIGSLPPLDGSFTRFGFVDLMGTGTPCLVVSTSLQVPVTSRLRYVDLLGGRKANLLSSVVNNFGAETRISYAPSTRFYLEDKVAGNPWITKLPFPVHVVECVEQLDHVTGTKLVTRYKYHHGFYDSFEREFRGFALVEQWDAESFGGSADRALDQPPVLTRTWFHTGAWLRRDRLEALLAEEYFEKRTKCEYFKKGFTRTPLPGGLSLQEEREAARALRGRMLRQEVYAEDGSEKSGIPYVVTERGYGVRLLQHAQNGGHAVFLPHDAETLTLHYERTPADPRVLHEVALEVDEYGNPLRSASIAYPRRAGAECEAQERPLVTITERSFIHRPAEATWYRINVPLDESVWELTGVEAVPGQLLHAADLNTFFGFVPEARFEEEVGFGVEMKRLVSRTRHRYRGDDLSGVLADPSVGALAFGQIESRALPYESYQLAFTQGLLDEVFGTRIDPALVESEGRYVRLDDAWWIPSGRVIPAADRFYQPVAAFDPFGNKLSIDYDAHSLLAVAATDQVGNVVSAENCYRVLAPRLVTDPNGNRTAVEFNALGMVVRTALMGKAGAGEGDTLEDPTSRLVYDLHAWRDRGRPVFVEAQAREQHGAANPRWQRSISYSDGHGQEVMKKVQAEPGYAPKRDAEGNLVRDAQGKVIEEHTPDRWVGTGRTVFNNKGNPVKQYEPFFSSTPAYEDERDVVETGVTPILHYDPVGRLVCTENPDGTEARTVFDAWREESWDEIDSLVDPETGDFVRWAEERAGLPDKVPERRALDLALAHAQTPNSTKLDVLGRSVVIIENIGGGREYETRLTLDIVGNQRSVIDARGNAPAVQDFDLLKRLLRVNSCDAGERRTFPDVTGKPIYAWDARGTIVRCCFDALERPTHVYVTAPDTAEVLAERTFYGEKHPDRLARNLAGKPCLSFDGAGAAIQDAYDFKGNPVRTQRRLATQYQGTIDWTALASTTILPGDALGLVAPQLETEVFESSSTFDALGRIVTSTSPDGSVTRPTFNEANLLERLEVRLRGAAAWTTFVAGVDYNARGQRLVIEYGNGTRAKYTYDPERFRLTLLSHGGLAWRDRAA